MASHGSVQIENFMEIGSGLLIFAQRCGDQPKKQRVVTGASDKPRFQGNSVRFDKELFCPLELASIKTISAYHEQAETLEEWGRNVLRDRRSLPKIWLCPAVVALQVQNPAH